MALTSALRVDEYSASAASAGSGESACGERTAEEQRRGAQRLDARKATRTKVIAVLVKNLGDDLAVLKALGNRMREEKKEKKKKKKKKKGIVRRGRGTITHLSPPCGCVATHGVHALAVKRHNGVGSVAHQRHLARGQRVALDSDQRARRVLEELLDKALPGGL